MRAPKKSINKRSRKRASKKITARRYKQKGGSETRGRESAAPEPPEVGSVPEAEPKPEPELGS